jgi:hypothetical protein
MLTTDFTGTYDYEKTEAEAEAEHYLHLIAEASQDEQELSYLARSMGKLSAHWGKILETPEQFEEFCQHFNAKMPDARFHI